MVVAEWFQRQQLQRRPLFGKHGGDLSFRGAVDARIGPACFPVVQIGLGFLEGFEAQAFQRGLLGVGNPCLDLTFSIGIRDPARQGDDAIMSQHVAVEGIERGIVDVWREHALAQVVEHDHSGTTAHAPEGLLVQLRPDLGAGAKREQANRFAAVPQRQNEQPCATILAGMGVAHHGPVP
jgi:hypothetical protein